MIIKNGKVLNDNFNFTEADVEIKNDKIEAIGCFGACEDFIDAKDCYVVPGFIDTHMHAAMGETFIDFTPETQRKITEFEANNGTTSLVPAISAAPEKKLLSCIDYMKECIKNPIEGCARIRGIHMEGPFFSEKYKGAHLSENIRNCDVNEFKKYLEHSGEYIKIITLAPELPGSDELIPYAVKNGVVVSAGHTNATFEDVNHAIELGASQGTHLFNAMSPMNHRTPGTVGALLASDKVKCELICDFFHVHKDVVKLVYKIKGSDRINIITDSEVGTGLPDGEYVVNGRVLTVKDKKTYTEDGTIAGGTSCIIDCVRNLVSIGIPLENVCKMASKNPALTAGIYDNVGSISVGKTADVLILDKELNLKNVILGGNKIK